MNESLPDARRRDFLTALGISMVGAAAGATSVATTLCADDQPKPKGKGSAGGVSSPGRRHGNPIGVSTYSFWQFRNEKLRDIGKCIDLAAEWGFDGVEILHRQMTSEDNGYVQRLKRQAFVNGLALCGFSTHQGFVSPDKSERR